MRKFGMHPYMSKQHLHRYCTEFGYRYSIRQQTSAERFEDAALSKVSSEKITYNKLIGK